jgi:hypothetical protein
MLRPEGGNAALPSSSSIPIIMYPPPQLLKSFAKAVIVLTVRSGFQPFLNSMRSHSTVRPFSNSFIFIGKAII